MMVFVSHPFVCLKDIEFGYAKIFMIKKRSQVGNIRMNTYPCGVYVYDLSKRKINYCYTLDVELFNNIFYKKKRHGIVIPRSGFDCMNRWFFFLYVNQVWCSEIIQTYKMQQKIDRNTLKNYNHLKTTYLQPKKITTDQSI